MFTVWARNWLFWIDLSSLAARKCIQSSSERHATMIMMIKLSYFLDRTTVPSGPYPPSHYWWLVRATYVVDGRFFGHFFGRWWGLYAYT